MQFQAILPRQRLNFALKVASERKGISPRTPKPPSQHKFLAQRRSIYILFIIRVSDTGMFYLKIGVLRQKLEKCIQPARNEGNLKRQVASDY